MTDTAVLPAGGQEKTVIQLHIISPSLPRLVLSDVATSTTVGDLKAKISEVSPSHPPSAHQRLIYRGHPLIRHEQTLKDVFTQALVCNFQDADTFLLLKDYR